MEMQPKRLLFFDVRASAAVRADPLWLIRDRSLASLAAFC
jgi:hypothetical protein